MVRVLITPVGYVKWNYVFQKYHATSKQELLFIRAQRNRQNHLVKSAFHKSVYIDLLKADLFNDLTANQQRLANFIPPDFKDWIVIDEGNDYSLEHLLKFGQLPSVYVQDDSKKYLEAYEQTYLEDEIRQEGLIRNLSAFAWFLEAASFSQGSVLNISSVSRECHVERKTDLWVSITRFITGGSRMAARLTLSCAVRKD